MITNEELQRKDHDTLVRLETKMDQVIGDIKEMKDGTSKTLAALDERVKMLEAVKDKMQPDVVLRHVEDLVQWKREFNTVWRAMVTISATVSGIIGFTLATVLQVINLFGK